MYRLHARKLPAPGECLAPPHGGNPDVESEVQTEAWSFYRNFFPGGKYKEPYLPILGVRLQV
jgi:hypothetical protein